MPYLTGDVRDFLANGPQNRDFALARASEYASFQKGLSAATGLPIVSYEHSYATAVGGEAAKYGTTTRS